MNSGERLSYDLYSESEWRIIYFSDLLDQGLIVDPRDSKNSDAHAFFTSLDEENQEKLKYLVPLDGWLSLIIYPTHWVKNVCKQEFPSEVDELVRKIKMSVPGKEYIEGGNWPIEVDLDACRNF